MTSASSTRVTRPCIGDIRNATKAGACLRTALTRATSSDDETPQRFGAVSSKMPFTPDAAPPRCSRAYSSSVLSVCLAAPSSTSGERGCGDVCSTPLYSRPGARKRGGARSVHAVSALMIGAALEWSPRPHSNRALGATGSNTQSRLPPGRRAPPGNSRATAQRTRCTSGLVSGGRTATGSSPGCDSKMTAINVAATATVRSNLCPRTCMFGAARGEGPPKDSRVFSISKASNNTDMQLHGLKRSSGRSAGGGYFTA